MSLKKNNNLLKIILLAAVCIYSPLGLAETSQIEPFPATSEQGSVIEQDKELLEETEALHEDLLLKSKDARELFSIVLKSTGNTRSVAGIQVLDIEEEMRSLLDDLIANIDILNGQGIDTSEFFTTAKKLTQEQSQSIIEKIQFIHKLLSDRKIQWENSEQADIFKLTQSINQAKSVVDDLLRALLANTERMKLVELDISVDLGYLKNELKNLAISTSAQLKLNAREIGKLNHRIEKTGTSNNQDLLDELNVLEEVKTGLVSSLRSTIKMMKQLELETSEYSLHLIQNAGEIDESLLDKEVIIGLVDQWVSDMKYWLIDNGTRLIGKVFSVIFILFVFKLLAILSERLVRKAISSSRAKISKLLREFFETMVSRLVMIIGVLVALAHVGVQIGPLLAGLGVVGFIIGFALQDTLSNFASGIMILIYKPFDTGDIIEAAGQKGTVSQMSLVSTTIYTFDNQRLIIPNNKIWGDIIKNITSQEKRRVDFEFSVNNDADIDQVEGILSQVIEDHPLVMADPAPDIKLHRIEKSSLEFIARPWVKTTDYWQVYWDIMRAVKQRFDEAGILRPASRHDVQLVKTSE